jgi:hypothetical protein
LLDERINGVASNERSAATLDDRKSSRGDFPINLGATAAKPMAGLVDRMKSESVGVHGGPSAVAKDQPNRGKKRDAETIIELTKKLFLKNFQPLLFALDCCFKAPDNQRL